MPLKYASLPKSFSFKKESDRKQKNFQDFSKFCDRPQQGGHFGLLIKDKESKAKISNWKLYRGLLKIIENFHAVPRKNLRTLFC